MGMKHKKYLLGNSAFSASVMVPTLRKATMPTLAKKRCTLIPSW